MEVCDCIKLKPAAYPSYWQQKLSVAWLAQSINYDVWLDFAVFCASFKIFSQLKYV